MARYPSGQPVRLSWKTYQPDGTTLVDAGANSLTLKYANADGTTTATTGSPYTSPVRDSLGAYHQDVPASDLTVLGHYQWVNTATGAGAGIAYGDFDVFDPFEQALLPLADAKDHLQIAQTVTTYDARILSWVATIETSLEAYTGGPLVNRTITSERAVLTSNYTVLQVRQRPLVSVTSIVSASSGNALDISAGLDLDTNAGTIRRKLGWPFYGQYFVWLPAMLVTYVAGWGAAVPAAFNDAARIILENFWLTQHGPSARPGLGGEEMVTLPGWGYAIPNRAAQLLTNGSLNGMPFTIEAYV